MKRWMLVLAVIMAGCEQGASSSAKPDPTYKGIPRSQWVRQTEDADKATSDAAWDALIEIDLNDFRTKGMNLATLAQAKEESRRIELRNEELKAAGEKLDKELDEQKNVR